MSPDEMITYAEVRRMTALPLGTLYALVARRQIPHVRLGPRLVRFRRGEIEAWLAAHSVPAQPRKGER